MASTSVHSYESTYVVVPAETVLYKVSAGSVPAEGAFVDWLDVETGVTTRYKVADVIYEVTEIAADPPPPVEDPPLPASQSHVTVAVRVELKVVP